MQQHPQHGMQMQKQGYLPQQQDMPMHEGQGMPMQQQYPQQGYPPQQQGYLPQQQDMPMHEGQEMPMQQQYPQQGYPPQQQGYPPQQQGYLPQQGYPPQQGMPMHQGQPMMMQPMAQPPMARTDFDGVPNLLIKQTRKGWCQEFMGCEANTEFNIATFENPNNDEFYAIEDTSCLMRFCLGTARPFTLTVSQAADHSKTIGTYERPFRCPMFQMKCCCHQTLISKNDKDEEVGRIKEDCWFCVPSLKVLDKGGNLQYNMHFPTCCCGMCVDCCAGGCCNCRIPFGIYEPGASGKSGSEVGSVVKIWGGWGKELLSDADTFELIFPEKADSDTRRNLVGGVFMINQLFFEKQGGAQSAV